MLSRSSRSLLRTATTRRYLSSRASTVLSALDIPTTGAELDGVYDGAWKGSGELLESVCPTTGEVLARVKTVRPLYTPQNVRSGHITFACRPHRPRCRAQLHARARRTSISA